MSNARRFPLDELTLRPGTYFNPQTEILIVVDDSPEVDHEIFETRRVRQRRLGADRRGRAAGRKQARRSRRALPAHPPAGQQAARLRMTTSTRTTTTRTTKTTTTSSTASTTLELDRGVTPQPLSCRDGLLSWRRRRRARGRAVEARARALRSAAVARRGDRLRLVQPGELQVERQRRTAQAAQRRARLRRRWRRSALSARRRSSGPGCPCRRPRAPSAPSSRAPRSPPADSSAAATPPPRPSAAARARELAARRRGSAPRPVRRSMCVVCSPACRRCRRSCGSTSHSPGFDAERGERRAGCRRARRHAWPARSPAEAALTVRRGRRERTRRRARCTAARRSRSAPAGSVRARRRASADLQRESRQPRRPEALERAPAGPAGQAWAAAGAPADPSASSAKARSMRPLSIGLCELERLAQQHLRARASRRAPAAAASPRASPSRAAQARGPTSGATAAARRATTQLRAAMMCSGRVLSRKRRSGCKEPLQPAAAVERSISAVRASRLLALALGVLAVGAGHLRACPRRARDLEPTGARAPSAASRRPATAPPSAPHCRRCSAAARSPTAVYGQDYATYVAAKRLAGQAERHARRRTRRRARQRPGDRSRRRVHPLAAARAVPHARTQPPVVDERTAARQRTSGSAFPRASWCGSTTPARASRSSGWPPSARPTATTSPATKTPTCASSRAKRSRSATKRAGGIAWEYLFRFDGGAPPWTSGLSQGTALQVLARAWSRFNEPAYLTAAQQALGIFQTAAPVACA